MQQQAVRHVHVNTWASIHHIWVKGAGNRLPDFVSTLDLILRTQKMNE